MPDSEEHALDCDGAAEYLAVEMAETDDTDAPPPGQAELVAALHRAFASVRVALEGRAPGRISRVVKR